MPNKATADVKAAARVYSAEAVDTLASIMRTGESEQARIAAARELLDRAHGKAPQALTDGDGGPLIPPGSAFAFVVQQIPGAENRT